jgi:hypothetical protein
MSTWAADGSDEARAAILADAEVALCAGRAGVQIRAPLNGRQNGCLIAPT